MGVETEAPESAEDSPGAGGGTTEQVSADETGAPAAPWWHSPWRLLALGAAVLFLGARCRLRVLRRRQHGSSGSTVDVGFLQDMRAHHDQAVSMAFTYLEKPAGEQDAVLRSIAKTILAEQQFENGYMVGLLLDMGADPANETGQAMAWMDQPVPLERMPGMATEAQIDELQAATGPEADALFVELMTAHHEGGIHMAEYAAEQGSRRGRPLPGRAHGREPAGRDRRPPRRARPRPGLTPRRPVSRHLTVPRGPGEAGGSAVA